MNTEEILMNRYVVGYIDFYENKIDLRVVEADNNLEAMIKAVQVGYEDDENYMNWTRDIYESCKTEEEIKQYFSDSEIGVSSALLLENEES